MPAQFCNFCHVDLNKATTPKKPKPHIVKVLSTWLAALLFLSLAAWLVYVVATGDPLVPEPIRNLFPGFIRHRVGFLQ
jgi:hypothetical protein